MRVVFFVMCALLVGCTEPEYVEVPVDVPVEVDLNNETDDLIAAQKLAIEKKNARIAELEEYQRQAEAYFTYYNVRRQGTDPPVVEQQQVAPRRFFRWRQ